MSKKKSNLPKQYEEVNIKLKIEKAKNGYDLKVGNAKLEADGMKNSKTKHARAYYLMNKKYNNRVVFEISDDVRAEGSSLNLKKVLEAVNRSSPYAFYQKFLTNLYQAVTADALMPIHVIIHVSTLGFSVVINDNPVYACLDLYWSNKALTEATVKKVTTEISKGQTSDAEIMAEGYKESI